MATFEVHNFAQIQDAQINFGDLTVLVGPQASGKSLLLQWLKVAIDIDEIVTALKDAGGDVKSSKDLLDLIFGDGMSATWSDGQTQVIYNGKKIDPKNWTKGIKTTQHGKVFYIPAHRALLLAEGWPAPLNKISADTPVVARLFSQTLYQRFSGRQSAQLFPVERILKKQYRDLVDQAVFHGGKVELEKERLRYRLRLSYPNDVHLPFMTWTSGQREFTPLLLGLYQVLPPRSIKKRDDIDWVIIEEPEMGLHPNAIGIVMLLVLDLLWRGYKVIISTHSPLVLDIVWAIKNIKGGKENWQLLAAAFTVKKKRSVQQVMERALDLDYRIYFLDLDNKTHKGTARDISSLDPDALDKNESEWGGLTGFSSKFGEAVRTSVNLSE